MTTVTLRRPGELIALLPYHLGFHPTGSLVVVAVAGRRLALVQRVDLPDGPPAPGVFGILRGVLTREDPSGLVLVLYRCPGPDTDDLAQEVLAQVVPAGVEVLAVLLVDDGRWWAWGCDDPTCCPAEGHAVPAPADVPAVAEYVARGVAPLPDRRALAGLLRPAPGPADVGAADDPCPGGRPLATAPWLRRTQILRAWARLLDTPTAIGEPAPDDPAIALAGLGDVPLRDALLHRLAPGLVPRTAVDAGARRLVRDVLDGPAPQGPPPDGFEPDAGGVRSGLLHLVRSTPPGARAPALAVLAAWAWDRGDGALAAVALDEARADDPGYPLADLLGRLVAHGVHPACA